MQNEIIENNMANWQIINMDEKFSELIKEFEALKHNNEESNKYINSIENEISSSSEIPCIISKNIFEKTHALKSNINTNNKNLNCFYEENKDLIKENIKLKNKSQKKNELYEKLIKTDEDLRKTNEELKILLLIKAEEAERQRKILLRYNYDYDKGEELPYNTIIENYEKEIKVLKEEKMDLKQKVKDLIKEIPEFKQSKGYKDFWDQNEKLKEENEKLKKKIEENEKRESENRISPIINNNEYHINYNIENLEKKNKDFKQKISLISKLELKKLQKSSYIENNEREFDPLTISNLAEEYNNLSDINIVFPNIYLIIKDYIALNYKFNYIKNILLSNLKNPPDDSYINELRSIINYNNDNL